MRRPAPRSGHHQPHRHRGLPRRHPRRTRLLLRVHPSNFRIAGFTARPELRELVALGRERGVPVYEDLGSGCVVDLPAFGVHEPLVGESLRRRDLVSFSGDKLLGGPQAGTWRGNRRSSPGCGATPCSARCASAKSSPRPSSETPPACSWNAGTMPALALIRLPAPRFGPPPRRCWGASRDSARRSCRAAPWPEAAPRRSSPFPSG